MEKKVRNTLKFLPRQSKINYVEIKWPDSDNNCKGSFFEGFQN